MLNGGEVLLNIEIRHHPLESFIHKLGPVVHDYLGWDSEMGDNIMTKKPSYMSRGYYC